MVHSIVHCILHSVAYSIVQYIVHSVVCSVLHTIVYVIEYILHNLGCVTVSLQFHLGCRQNASEIRLALVIRDKCAVLC